MKHFYFKNNRLINYFLLLFIFSTTCFSQKYVAPAKQQQFDITLNYDTYTLKTEMLSHPKNITVANDLTYMWYASQKIIETKGGYEGKLIHGNYAIFYLDNQLKEQGTMNYGLRHKTWKYWYPDGKLREVITWKNGLKNGSYFLYNDYGQLMAKGNFKKNKLNGEFLTYGPTGNITEKKEYKNGEEIIQQPKLKKIKPAKIKKRLSDKKDEATPNDKKVISS